MKVPRIPCDFCRDSTQHPTTGSGWSACMKARCQGKLKGCVEEGIWKPETTQKTTEGIPPRGSGSYDIRDRTGLDTIDDLAPSTADSPAIPIAEDSP